MSRKKRNRAANDDPDGTFGDAIPIRNPAAVAAYRMSVAGLIPFAGAVLGPLAVFWAIIARLRWSRDPSIEGRPQIDAALMLGTFEAVANITALVFLYWDWSGR